MKSLNQESPGTRPGCRTTRTRWRGVALLLFTLGVGPVWSQQLQTQFLHRFPVAPANPEAPLMQASDGCFYGTTKNGGIYRYGTVFRITPDGTETPVVAFNGTNGANPWSGLVQAADGWLYGTTYAGGAYDKGTAFKLSTNGNLSVLCSFDGTNGANPYAGLTLASDGNFYGTTYYGGVKNNGTAYRLTPDGTITTLHYFRSDLVEAGNPRAGLVQGTDGNLYGANSFGGTTNCIGALFRMTLGGELTTLVVLNGANGSFPQSRLLQARDGYLYGSTSSKSIFRISLEGEMALIASFPSNVLISPLIEATNGRFYGTTYNGGQYGNGSVFELTPDGNLATLLSFTGSNGANPRAGLVQGTDGALYGTTESGGVNGGGTTFKVALTGELKAVHAFHSPEGSFLGGLLTEAADGSFYGTTLNGGAYGYGTLFRVTRAGAFTKLLDFDGATCDSPSALIQAKDGNFYGVSPSGGRKWGGVFFRFSPDGTLTPLLSFDKRITGSEPSSLVQGADGYFYGTSLYSTNGYGGVFRVSTNGVLTCLGGLSPTISGGGIGDLLAGPDGNFYAIFPSMGTGGTFFRAAPQEGVTVLYAFNRYFGTDGGDPSSLLLGTDGNFYGTTTSYAGTFFRMTPSGTLTTLFQFGTGLGTQPRLLARDTVGNFYGVTSEYGYYFFKITTNGVPTVLRPLGGPGGLPAPQSLVLGSDGILYGTFYAGSTHDGAIFRLVEAPTFTSIRPQSGGVFIAGTGPVNQPVQLWSAPDVTLPLSQWTLRTSGSFNAQGAFNFFDTDATTNRSRSYRLSLP